jgi:hypothetical protein
MSSTPHTYEEVRDAVVDILLGCIKTEYQPTQFEHLKLGVDEVFQRRERTAQASTHVGNPYRAHDAELVRDVFWDLFRQGYITLGLNDSNETWPFFRLERFPHVLNRLGFLLRRRCDSGFLLVAGGQHGWHKRFHRIFGTGLSQRLIAG